MKSALKNEKSILEKRLKRFFFSRTKSRSDFQNFIEMLTNAFAYDVFVFGGLVRDIYIHGIIKFYSDIDIVIDCEHRVLESFLESLVGLCFKRNKFGGFRVKFRYWDLDIWCVKDTWAFKSGLVDFNSPIDLLKTTFLNWDSVIFDVRTRRVICGDNYFSDIRQGILKIVLKENPNEIGSLVRVFRAIRSKYVKSIDFSLIVFISEKSILYCPRDVVSYEKISYDKRYLIESDVEEIYRHVNYNTNNSEFCLPTVMQLDLDFDI